MNNRIYVDTEQMMSIFESITAEIKTITGAIDGYTPSAVSLEGSTFKGNIDAYLNTLKTSYGQIYEPLLALAQSINTVKEEYESRATLAANTVSGGGSASSATAGSGSTSSSANYTY